MPKTALATGILLVVLGTALFLMTRSPTSLFPIPLGLIIAGAGGAALHPARRKAAMHLAAGVALLGALGSAGRFRGWLDFINGQTPPDKILAPIGTFLTFAICLIFLVMCVKSFRDARKNISS